MVKHKGEQTIFFKSKPRIKGFFAITGKKEKEGFFGDFFDYSMNEDHFGEDSFEKAERKMLEQAVFGAIDKSRMEMKDIGIMLSGDLLNQIISSSFAARSFDSAFLGLFAACSTMAESLALGSVLIDGGYFENVVCATSSHFSTAERQFRNPLELGSQRPPTSQWTVTGAGATILSKEGEGPFISSATFGKVTDYGINDVNNMGAAMAPAAMTTLVSHFKDTKTTPKDYDFVITGDLGKHGSEVLVDLLEEEGYKFSDNYVDCGHAYYTKNQKTFMGGSGCGCSATLLNSFFIPLLNAKIIKKILFCATGALLSTLSGQQGETIPGIAHAVVIERGEGGKNDIH